MVGTYREQLKQLWPDFRKEYEDKVLAGLAPRTRDSSRVSLGHFQRIVKPARVLGITTQDIDTFIAARRKEPGDKKGSLLSPASINHDLRHLKAAL